MNARFTFLGSADPILEGELLERLKRRQGKFRVDERKYVQLLNPAPLKEGMVVDSAIIENLRTLCQLWEVDIRPERITSHRKFIGPVIVLVKRIVFGMVRGLLKNTLRQQRDFNASVISAIAAQNASRKM